MLHRLCVGREAAELKKQQIPGQRTEGYLDVGSGQICFTGCALGGRLRNLKNSRYPDNALKDIWTSEAARYASQAVRWEGGCGT